MFAESLGIVAIESCHAVPPVLRDDAGEGGVGEVGKALGPKGQRPRPDQTVHGTNSWGGKQILQDFGGFWGTHRILAAQNINDFRQNQGSASIGARAGFARQEAVRVIPRGTKALRCGTDSTHGTGEIFRRAGFVLRGRRLSWRRPVERRPDSTRSPPVSVGRPPPQTRTAPSGHGSPTASCRPLVPTRRVAARIGASHGRKPALAERSRWAKGTSAGVFGLGRDSGRFRPSMFPKIFRNAIFSVRHRPLQPTPPEIPFPNRQGQVVSLKPVEPTARPREFRP